MAKKAGKPFPPQKGGKPQKANPFGKSTPAKKPGVSGDKPKKGKFPFGK